MTKLFHTKVEVVVIDSGFCIMLLMIDLRKVGVLTAAVIKKRRYWNRHIPEHEINKYRKTK